MSETIAVPLPPSFDADDSLEANWALPLYRVELVRVSVTL
jgi:hypothetical protein